MQRARQESGRNIREVLPDRLCNLDRLLYAMDARHLDGLIITNPLNIFYLTSFNGVAHKSDEPRPYALILSKDEPENPILVIADYYLSSFSQQPTWISNIKPFRGVMMPLDLAPKSTDIERFISTPAKNLKWIEAAKKNYKFKMRDAVESAVKELALSKKEIGFDDMALGFRLSFEGLKIRDAYDCMMYARAVKTPEERVLLKRATELNQEAIQKTVASWEPGVTWRDIDNFYTQSVIDLGGFVRDPGGMIWGHPRGSDPALMLNAGLDNGEVHSGTHVMFDCHGTLDLYCWDGGKTWVVNDTLSESNKKIADGTGEVASAVIAAMKPGAKISELQALGRSIYRKVGISDPESAVIFFHGLGLSHMDIETTLFDGTPNVDWKLEENMVVPLHLLYPGGEKERLWLEEVVLIRKDGGEPLFSWGFNPLVN